MAGMKAYSSEKILIDASDAESESSLSARSGLSIAQVSDLLRSYVVVPKSRTSAFDAKAITQLQKQLADAQQENYQLRSRIFELENELERIRSGKKGA